LVVPHGVELIFAIREVLTRKRQKLDFDVMDLAGNPVCRVLAREKHIDGANCGLHVQYINGEPLAFIRTAMLHDGSEALPEICRADGQVYCRLVLDNGSPLMGKYALQNVDGEQIMFFQGDFLTRAINGIAPSGIVVSSSQRCNLDLAYVPKGQTYFKVRIAPAGDIGLLLCGMLAVDKVERRACR
jgi:hypothetical protein